MARAKSEPKSTSATASPDGDTPTPKRRPGRPPKSETSGTADKKTPTNGRRKRRVGRPPKADAAKVAKKATGKSERKTPATTVAKKRVGRPPKTASAKAKSTGSTAGDKKRVGRPRKAVGPDDGRRIPVSATTTRALAAATRAADALKKERNALASAVEASTTARMKARATGQKRDKTLAKKARQKVQRLSDKVAVRRAAAREAKANVTKLKAEDLLNARMNNIEVRLQRAEEAATATIEAKLERQTEKFRATTLDRLDKVEARKRKKRARKAESDRAALMRKSRPQCRRPTMHCHPRYGKKDDAGHAPSEFASPAFRLARTPLVPISSETRARRQGVAGIRPQQQHVDPIACFEVGSILIDNHEAVGVGECRQPIRALVAGDRNNQAVIRGPHDSAHVLATSGHVSNTLDHTRPNRQRGLRNRATERVHRRRHEKQVRDDRGHRIPRQAEEERIADASHRQRLARFQRDAPKSTWPTSETTSLT